MRTSCLVVAAVLWAHAAWAQTDEPDASLPDASVGQGGADHTSEENDPNTAPCLSSSDCDRGFACRGGRCVPAPITDASCGGVPLGVALLAVGLAGSAGRRRRRG